jgi:hypothetical protein
MQLPERAGGLPQKDGEMTEFSKPTYLLKNYIGTDD